MVKKPVVLIIMDGYGISEEQKGNAILLAKKPNIEGLMKKYPHTILKASEESVGLTKGQISSSEAGHMNIGAGRIIVQDLPRINSEIQKGTFFTNQVLMDTIKYVKENNSTLHLMGLLSEGGVHSHINHLFALLELAHHHFLDKVSIHCFLDGRDTEPMSAKKYIRMLEKQIEKTTGTISTIIGRYYAMDRDKRWKREKKAYDLLVNGIGLLIRDPMEAVNSAYRAKLSDEFVKPTLINQGGLIKEKDAVIFFNFRSDRARQLTKALTDPKFNGFKTKKLELKFVCFTEFDKENKHVDVVFPSIKIKNSLSEVLSQKKKRQLKIAETEKFSHVTYFFNNGVYDPFKGEERLLINSQKVQTYDQKPEMSANVVTAKAINAIKRNKHDFIVINYPNCDMVGHTGKLSATIKAVEIVDKCVGKIIEQVEKKKGVAVVTSSHGSAEAKEDKFGRPLTAHTLNPVPLIITKQGIKISQGKLSDIAPTILKLMNIKPPKEMTGHCLIRK